MANEIAPRFFTQIPTYLNGKGLNSSDKLIYGIIYTMLNVTGKCFMSNARIAEAAELNIGTVKNSLTKMKKLDLINTNKTYKPNSKEVDKRFITIQEPPSQISDYPVTNKLHPRHLKVQDNKSLNKSVNNIRSSTDEHESASKKSKDEQVAKDEQDVISYLNNTIKSDRYKSSKDLRSRLKEGYTPTQLKQVIYYCAVSCKWLTSTNNDGVPMVTYLRPKTLFKKSKCEEYLTNAHVLADTKKAKQQKELANDHIDEKELYS